MQPRHAVLQGTRRGPAAIRAAAADAEISSQRRPAGHRPDPGAPRRQDPDLSRTRSSPSTTRRERATPSSSTPAPSPTCRRPAKPRHRRADRAAGWCVSPTGASTRSGRALVFGRDAGSDVVVGGTDVSRRHAEIQRPPRATCWNDLSVNGTYVNGERVGRQHLLARADVIRIGHDEFRFYADVARPRPRAPRRSVPPETPAAPADRSQRTPVRHDARLAATAPQRESPRRPVAAGRRRLASLLVRSGALRGPAAADHGAGRSTSAGRTTTIWSSPIPASAPPTPSSSARTRCGSCPTWARPTALSSRVSRSPARRR